MTPHEEQQCKQIAGAVRSGAKTGVIVDDDAKAGRFIDHIRGLCPEAMVTCRMPFYLNQPQGPVLIKFEIPNAVRNN